MSLESLEWFVFIGLTLAWAIFAYYDYRKHPHNPKLPTKHLPQATIHRIYP